MVLYFIVGLCTIVASLILGFVFDSVKPTMVAPRTKGRVILVVSCVVGLGLCAVAAIVQSHLDQNDSTDAGNPHEGSSGSFPSPATTPALIPAESPLPQPATAMATSLLDLPAVDQHVTKSIDLEQLDTVLIDGTSYGQALAYSCSLFCNGTSPQILEVSLGRQFKKFTATAVVLDTSSGTYRIDITLDGQPPMSFATSPGSFTAIEVNVENVSRMRIQMYAAESLKGPLQAGSDTAAGENGGGLPGVALADPLLLP